MTHLAEVRPAARPGLPFRCPVCKGPLVAEPAYLPELYRCAPCARDYPVVLGIPDFRVFPDPYIDIADDHAKAGRLVAEEDGLSFQQLVERYWEMTPTTPGALARRYVRHALGGVDRGCASLEEVRRARATLGAKPLADEPLLDVGCGTGGFLLAAAERYDQAVVGVDIAFRWLVIARKRVVDAERHGLLSPEQAGRIHIVCCCAEYLPFPDHSFGTVVASDVIAHTARQEQLLRQSRHALRPGGVLFLATPNRFSLTPEPHVRVWGVGFLPRSWMGRYVRRMRGVDYQHVRPVSLFDLMALLRRAGFARWRVLLPRLSQAELQRYPRRDRWAAAVYHRLALLPIFRELLYVCGPLFHVVAVAPEAL